MRAVQMSSQKRVRSVSLDVMSRPMFGLPPGLSTLLHAVDKVAVANIVDITNTHCDDAVKPGISFLLDAATTVSPAKKPRRTSATEISDDDEEFFRKRRPMMLDRSILLHNITPSAEELAEATTFRSRTALKNWYDRLRELYEYKAIHHDCLVPQKYPPNPALGIWVNKQRMEKKLLDQGGKSSMTKYRLEKLDQAGFHWAKQKGDVSWETKYAELCEFHQKHGHCIVPTKYAENSALGRWTSTQRSQAKEWLQGRPTHMTRERYDKLCELNFQFDRLCPKGDTAIAHEAHDGEKCP